MEAWAIRLQRDLKELDREPLEGIQIHLHENDMRHMCLILSPSVGPFSHWRLHLDVQIPRDYPRAPPEVTIQTTVPHPNVFDSYICCDILKGDPDYYYGSSEGGYTPGYLLKYIFLQLLSFFSSRRIEQDIGGSVRLDSFAHRKSSASWQANVKRFACSTCGFNINFPAKVDRDAKALTGITLAEGGRSSADCGNNLFQLLDVDCCLQILDRLSDQDTIRLTQAFEVVKQVADAHNSLLRRQLVCFYLRKTFMEAVLGIGVLVNEQKPVVTMIDLLSYEAYSLHSVTRGVTRTQFNYFLPVALNDNHFGRGIGILRATLMSLSNMHFWSPRTVLQTIPTMMNMMVLKLVQSCDAIHHQLARGVSNSDVDRASEKALQGYCLLFHLLSKLVRCDPQLANEIQQKVNRFMESGISRQKSSVPDLGEFLTYFLVVGDIDWGQACGLFLEELLARNVVWYLNKFAHLAYMEPDRFLSEKRLRDTFSASLTSLRLVMFQVNFFNLTRPTLAEFDQRYGYPSNEMSSSLLKTVKHIYAVNEWDVFMKMIGYELPASADWKWSVSSMLKAAVRMSDGNRYHVNPYSETELYVLRRDLEIRCPPPRSWPGSKEERYEVRYNSKYRVNTSKSFFPRDNAPAPKRYRPR